MTLRVRSRHNGQSSSLGLLPPTDFGGTPTPDPSVGKPSSRTGSLRVHQSPTAGNPLRLRSAPYACGTATPIGASCTPVPWLGGNPTASRHNGGNPNARSLCRETLLQDWLRKALLWASGLVATTRLTRRPSGSPVAYGGRPSCSAGLTRYLCRETLIKYWLPPGSPVAYGGKPASVCVAPPMPAARLRRSRAAGIGGATQTERVSRRRRLVNPEGASP